MASSSPSSATPAPEAAYPLTPAPFLVRDRTAETADTVSLRMAPAAGGTWRGFRPGQFNMVYLFGVGEVAVSVSGDPARSDELVHTVRAVGKVSAGLSRLMPGDAVGVRGPYGHGWPVEEARGHDVVVVAGGLGFAPLRPVLYDMLAHRDRYGRFEVIHGARTPKDLLYYPELQAWRSRPDLRCQVTVDAAGRDWYGDVGLVTQRIPDCRFDPSNTVAFVCGPEVMMRFTALDLAARGVPETAIHLSLERNMKCAVGLCGHCQFGPAFVCRNGPVLRYSDIRPMLTVREL